MMEFDADAAVQAAIDSKTEEERERERHWQEEQRARLVLPTEMQIKAEFGRRMEVMALEALAENPTDFEYSRLAEAKALQGDWKAALELTRDPLKREEYEAVVAAIENPHDCGCPLLLNRMPTRFTKNRIIADGRQLDVIACSVCGHLKC